MLKLLSRPIRKFSKYCVWLWRQEGTPAQRARGLAVGVFSGCFPLFGLQTILGILLSTLVKGNRLLAISGTWISNPMTYVPLYWFNYFVGCIFLGHIPNAVVQNSNITFLSLWDKGSLVFLRMLLGSLVVGLFMGTLTGFFLYYLLTYSKNVVRK